MRTWLKSTAIAVAAGAVMMIGSAPTAEAQWRHGYYRYHGYRYAPYYPRYRRVVYVGPRYRYWGPGYGYWGPRYYGGWGPGYYGYRPYYRPGFSIGFGF